MAEKVNNLTEKISKLEIGAKFEKWNEFPPEIKLECISKMDFKMRVGLRSTSHAERELVDSLRYKFDRVCLGSGNLILENGDDFMKNYYLGFYDDNGNFSSKRAIPFLTYIFNKCDIEKLMISFGPAAIEQPILVLEKCWASLEFVEINIFAEDMPLNKIFTLPAIINAKKVVIPFLFKNQVAPLMKEWLKLDLKIGTKLGIGSSHQNSALETIRNNVILRDDSKFLISTNNPEKHILMFDTKFDGLHCVVIPSNLDKSKYDELIRSF